MGEFRKVATTSEIETGQMKSFTVGFDQIVICNVAGKYFALTDECSHDSAPIGEGTLEGTEIVCPRHGARFNIETGDVTAPPAVVPIDTYEVKIEGTDILVNLGD